MAKRESTRKEDLVTILSSIKDPRVDRTRAHELRDILTIGLCSMLCGHSDFTVMAEFASARREWFESFLELPGGIPSHDTFGRVFAAIDPDEFLSAFVRWTRTVRHLCRSGVVAIDGKALRRAKEAGEQAPVIVGAWGAQAEISLGQVKVDGKTTVFRRYFITSLGADVEVIGTAVREHSGIENSLHWVLDMTWREDESRAKAGDAAQNLSSLRRLAHNLIKTEDPASKISRDAHEDSKLGHQCGVCGTWLHS